MESLYMRMGEGNTLFVSFSPWGGISLKGWKGSYEIAPGGYNEFPQP